MLEQLTLPYWLAMAFVHAGFTTIFTGAFVELRRPRVVFGAQLALLTAYTWQMQEVYVLVPALWWPDATEHLWDALTPLYRYAAVSLVVMSFSADQRRRRARRIPGLAKAFDK